MLRRRDLLTLAGLTGAAVAVPGVLAGCSSGTGGSRPELRLAASRVNRAPGSAEEVPGAVAAMGRLGGRLLGAVGNDGNVVLSPYSATVALSMTLLGARRETAREMRRVLGVHDAAALAAGLNALTQELEALSGAQKRADGSTATLTLESANALFGQDDTSWDQGFLDAMARHFGAGMLMVDYRAEAARARRLINGWTAEQTHDRITDIVPPGVLNLLTRLVLVDAVYLRAPWEQPFERSATRPGVFHRADGSTVEVDLMNALLEGVRHAETSDWQAVRLPYAGNALAMTVVLPRPGAMNRTWRAVTSGDLSRLLAAPGHRAVQLSLPRWRLRTTAPLGAALSALGMPTAFDAVAADFSGMTRDERLHIGAVLHEAYVAVDEDGTEAAAATAVTMDALSAPVPVPIRVDRPFVFVIHDVAHLTPLFVGRVDDPTT